MTTKTRRKSRANRDTSRDYVNGPQMHQAILEWYESGKTEPPKIVVDAIIQICERLSTKNNFKNYTYNDEMVAEGILACSAAIVNKKYDPYKWNNPFAYFTMIAHNAFISVIKAEQKETYIKHKSLEDYMLDAAVRGETISYETDDSGRIEKLVNQFEGKRKEDEDEE